MNRLMASMSEMVQQNNATQQQATAAATAATTAGGQRERLVAKFFQCQQFSGKPQYWSDFAFRFKRVVRSQSVHTYEEMGEAEIMDGVANDSGFEAPRETSATLYDILCQHVEGDALVIMKSVRDCNGFAAWQALFRNTIQ